MEQIDERRRAVNDKDIIELLKIGENDVKSTTVDFSEIFATVWRQKLKVIGFTFICAVLSVIYALSQPNIYRSTIHLVPTQNESGGLSSLASKYGGLAAMAGINIGSGEGNKIEHAVELMQSWPYLERVFNEYQLKETFFATDGWNEETDSLIYDESVYDVEAKAWVEEMPLFGSKLESLEPTSYETYVRFMKHNFNVSLDDELGILSMSITHYSPNEAHRIVNLLVEDVNQYFKLEDQREALASIKFIEEKIASTSNTSMLEVFYGMVESHTQTLMLTEVNAEYLVKTLIPAKIPEEKVGPKRLLILILGTVIGGLIAVAAVIVKEFLGRNRTVRN